MIKQVIVVRKDLNMRKGKMIAQGAHASLQAYHAAKSQPPYMDESLSNVREWFAGEQTKICVGVDSEAELIAVSAAAALAGLPNALIQDAGHTEFKEPTYTAVAIGPADADEIDKITGKLKLL